LNVLQGFRQTGWLAGFSVVVLLASCNRDHPPRTAATPAPAPATSVVAASQPAAGLQDVIERDPRYMIGISYPPIAKRYPGLAAELKRYADGARTELMRALAALGQAKPAAPYDLSLSFTEVIATPQLVAIAAEGSSYTGGAHAAPLVARFVWLPAESRRLTAQDLMPDPAAWRDISAYVREQLQAALSQRVDADALAPADRAQVLKDAGRMIDEGTGPDVDNFSQFEPVLAADGRIAALRFVFPPYQVGPYADGTQTVDVPADVLLPRIAPPYRQLFVGS
jgi:Arc/MetJ-type ribon-helix-helix transcriptional regulator